MRAILLILILGVVVLIAAFASGFLHLAQTREAVVPSVAVASNGVVAKGGQAPSFEVESGSVAVGTQQKDVALPTVKVPVPSVSVNRPAEQAPANTAAAQ